jgi:hypothetical protein
MVTSNYRCFTNTPLIHAVSREGHRKPHFQVLGPIKTPLGLPAAVQERFLGWGNELDWGFRVATGKTRFAPIFGVQLDHGGNLRDFPLIRFTLKFSLDFDETEIKHQYRLQCCLVLRESSACQYLPKSGPWGRRGLHLDKAMEGNIDLPGRRNEITRSPADTLAIPPGNATARHR